MKIAVVTPIPTPYRDPFWEAVSAQDALDLDVYYCHGGKEDRPWRVDWNRNFHSEVLPGWNLAHGKLSGASCFMNQSIVSRLREGRYDALVVGGYNHPTFWLAMRYAHRNRIPFYITNESHLHRRRTGWRSRIKGPAVRWVVFRAAGGFPTGEYAERYLMHYGADVQSLTRIPNVPDVDSLSRAASELRANRTALRHHHGIPDRPTILFVGRLISKKRAELLLRAYDRCIRVENGFDAQLVIVGDGMERERLVQLAETLGVAESVHFVGFRQPDEISQWHAMADLFVLPSSETWGVSVLEALSSGLPVIVSDEVGCHPDVICNSVVGEVVPARSEEALAEAMYRRLSNSVDADTVAHAWRHVRSSMRYDILANRFTEHLRRDVQGWVRRAA